MKRRSLVRRKAKEYLGRELSRQASFLGDFLGVPSRRIFDSKERERFGKKIERWFDAVFDTFTADWNTLTTVEQMERLRGLFERQIRLVERVPKGARAIDWMLSQMEQILRPVPGNSKLQRSYYRYSRATGWLVGRLFMEERVREVQEFFSGFVRSEVAISFGQIYALQALPRYAFLDRVQAGSLKARDIRKLIDLFGLLFGLYEKTLRVLVVISRIRRGNPATYEDVRRIHTKDLEDELRRERALRPIAPRRQRPIRNAIAHPQYRILHSEKKIRFTNGKQIEVTWNQLKENTIELSILLLAVTVTPFLHFLRTYLQTLSRVFRKGPTHSN